MSQSFQSKPWRQKSKGCLTMTSDFFRSEYTKHLQKTTLWFIDNIWCHEAIVLLPSSFTLKNLRRLPFWLNLHAKLHLWPYRSTSYIILFCQQEFFLHWNWLFSLLFITLFSTYVWQNMHIAIYTIKVIYGKILYAYKSWNYKMIHIKISRRTMKKIIQYL